MADPFSTSDAFSYLTGQGLPAHQAAALVGNMQQESSMNPTALNQGEGAYGLMQWRGDRRQGLQDFAQSTGSDASNPRTQLDFALHEMNGPEAKTAASFLAAPDVTSANTALKGFIRYGDNSQGARLANAQTVLGSGAPAGASAATSPAAVSPAGAAPVHVPAGILAQLGQPQQAAPDMAGILAQLSQPAAAQQLPMTQFAPVRARMRGLLGRIA